VSFLKDNNIESILVTTPDESPIVEAIQRANGKSVRSLSGLSLPEVAALASQASIFIGNDSGIAHIAAAVETPSVVIFGSSNRVHWKPWTNSPNRMVFHTLSCQPCPGDYCREHSEPKCILSVTKTAVFEAIDQVLEEIR
jgi:ADP-heptose:LPS heptosyltransferase